MGPGEVAQNQQRQGDCSYLNGKHKQSNAHNVRAHNGQHRQGEFNGGMTHSDLWYWLINHGVPRHEIDKKLTAVLFYLYKQKILKQMKERLHWMVAKGNLGP